MLGITYFSTANTYIHSTALWKRTTTIHFEAAHCALPNPILWPILLRGNYYLDFVFVIPLLFLKNSFFPHIFIFLVMYWIILEIF